MIAMLCHSEGVCAWRLIQAFYSRKQERTIDE
jgi:hypothetical protein